MSRERRRPSRVIISVCEVFTYTMKDRQMKKKIVGIILGIMIVASSAFALPWKSGQGIMRFSTAQGNQITIQGITERGVAWGYVYLPNETEHAFFYDGKKGYILNRPDVTTSGILGMNDAGTMLIFLNYTDGYYEDVLVRYPFFKGFTELKGIIIGDGTYTPDTQEEAK